MQARKPQDDPRDSANHSSETAHTVSVDDTTLPLEEADTSEQMEIHTEPAVEAFLKTLEVKGKAPQREHILNRVLRSPIRGKYDA